MTALVVTTIARPNEILRALAAGAVEHQWPFFVIGDVSSPDDFSLPGATYFSVEDQISTGLATAVSCPIRHYARKNVGYLLAMRGGADSIVESDDDNRPYTSFWNPRAWSQSVPVSRDASWINVLRYFGDATIWPRGFPLDEIRQQPAALDSLPVAEVECPIQQGLVDGDPDVDAIYRLTLPLPSAMPSRARSVAIGNGSWCPFNSQNTAWARDAFPLLYLPAYCTFRMTDIWRSFVAQRIAHANAWAVLYHEATVCQERNQHNLMRDFESEIPGYLHNRAICEGLAKLTLPAGSAAMADNLRACYQSIIAGGFLDRRELALLDCWIADLP